MFIEITRGRSFKGLAQYCLHDVRAKTQQRVSFVETRNLASDNPQVAWRIMTSRHFLQNQLKTQSGICQGGRKDGKPVGHLVIGWRNDEAAAQKLDRVQMVAAANGALRAIGASQYQAMIIAHNDTEHPHCHVIINLIGDDGRLKKNWKEREKLSRFALQYEQEHHGEAIIKQRELNWEDRRAGETPTPIKKKPRHLYELEQAAKESPEVQQFMEKHVQELAVMERTKADYKKRHRFHQERFKELLNKRIHKAQVLADQQIRKTKSEIRKAYKERRMDLLLKQEEARREFEQKEQTLKGSISNALSMIDWKQLLSKSGNHRQNNITLAFQILTSEGARREKLSAEQVKEKESLRLEQRSQEEARINEIQQTLNTNVQELKAAYVRKTNLMKERQARRDLELKAKQQQLTRERNEVLSRNYDQQQRLEQKQEVTVDLESNERMKPKFEVVTTKTRTRRERKPRKPRPPRQQRNQMAQDNQLDTSTSDPKIQDDFEKRMMQELFNEKECVRMIEKE